MLTVYFIDNCFEFLNTHSRLLQQNGFDCKEATDFESYQNQITDALPDVVVLKWNSQHKNLSLSQKIRENPKTKNTYIIFISDEIDIETRLKAWVFADYFLIEPFDSKELVAILHSISRRIKNKKQARHNWHLYLKEQELQSPYGDIIALTHRECILFHKLATSDSIVSYQQLVESLGENWLTFEKNRLELLFSRLRKKIKQTDPSGQNLIRTVRNQGYYLSASVIVYA